MPSSWSEAHVRRLFWRAGFGATPEEAAKWARRGRKATLKWILDGDGRPALSGPGPRIEGAPLQVNDEWGHDVLWWLDRMVRTRRPLVEKMTLFWHDHFATRDQDTPLMLRQNRTLRKHALGSFPKLLRAVTEDPAMLLFLSLVDNRKDAPNENYARELMELFTLGRGYTERDIREAARALTGFYAEWPEGRPPVTRYSREQHDPGTKRIFGRRGRYDWKDVCDLVVRHPRHAPFLVEKLWDYFVARPLDRRTRRRLAATYKKSGHRIKPVVAQILAHPKLYADLDAPDMVKSPVVFVAGALRATGTKVDRRAYTWLLEGMGQTPFRPPSVAGWTWGTAWLSTNAMKVRHDFVNYISDDGYPLSVPEDSTPTNLSPEQALDRAWRACGKPWMSRQTREELLRMARHLLSGDDESHDWQRLQTRADMCQRAMRQLLIAGPDGQVH